MTEPHDHAGADPIELSRRSRELRELTLSALFLVAIALPGLAHLAFGGVGGKATRLENRAPEPAPGIPTSAAALATFPQRFGAYFDDTFVLRARLVPAHNALMLALGASPHPTLIVGRSDGAHDWLFYTGHRVIEGHRGLDPFSAEALRRWREAITRRRDRLRALGVPLVLAVAPAKPSVYPEMLPAWATQVGPRRTDAWLEAMTAAGLEPTDLTPAVLAAKERERVFYPLGTHWNAAGAYAAYRVLHERLARRLAVGPAIPRASLTVATVEGETWGHQLMLPGLRAPSVGLSPPSPPSPPTLRAWVYADSFFIALQPFLAHHLRLKVHDLAAEPDWSRIERARPDVVLWVILERNLVTLPRRP